MLRPLFVSVLVQFAVANSNDCGSAGFSSIASYSFASFTFNGSFTECGCNRTVVCIRKCCSVGYSLREGTCVKSWDQFGVPVYKNGKSVGHASSFSLVSGMMQCAHQDGYYRLEPQLFPEDEFYLQDDGRLWQPNMNTYIGYDRFCLEKFEDMGVSALVCSSKAAKIGKKLNFLGMMISLPLLFATFVVYALLPDRNLHGKSLMCYVLMLFGGYAMLVFIQLNSRDLGDAACQTVALLCLFFFMVSFFWMNVMCVDIWWTFSGLRGFSGSKRESERKHFLLYSGYAWGAPLLLVLLVFCLTAAASPNSWYYPGIGDGQCWFRSGIPTLLYFYIPLGLLIVVNTVLFVKTACKIKQIRKDTSILRKDDNSKSNYGNDKQRFNLYVKLLLAMGVNWSMEIISWAVDWQVGYVPPAVWYLTDFCNALYGVFIFFIFVFKKSVWNLLKRRYYLTIGKVHLARSMARNAELPRTTETSLSRSTTNI